MNRALRFCLTLMSILLLWVAIESCSTSATQSTSIPIDTMPLAPMWTVTSALTRTPTQPASTATFTPPSIHTKVPSPTEAGIKILYTVDPLPKGPVIEPNNVPQIKLRQVILLPDRPYQARALAFSPDMDWLAIGLSPLESDQPRLIFMDTETGQLHTLNQHIHSIYSLAFHPNGKLLVAGTDGGELLFIELPSFAVLSKHDVTKREILDIVFSPDGNHIAYSDVQHVTVLDLDSFNSTFVFDVPSETGDFGNTFWWSAGQLAFDVEAKYLAGAHTDFLRVWEWQSGHLVIDGSYQNVCCLGGVNFSPDGKWLSRGVIERT
jgi:WD40 repeat protein